MRPRLLFLNSVLFFILLLTAGNAWTQVTVTSSDSLSCTIPCTTLTAHVTGDAPTDAGVTADDVYSGVIPIGFTFNYYGTNYTQCVLGANGTIDFTVSDAGAYDPWPISAVLLGNPSKKNNICGPWCDIDIFYTGTPVGTETYSTDGVAPFRKFAATWCGCSMFSCGTQKTTTQIILYETTNIIEVHIAQKPVCSTWNGGYAIVGVQNAAGTAATVAPGRDYPSVWTIPPTEAWRFTPAGGGSSYTVASIPYAPIPLASSAVYWYDATTGAYLGTGDTLRVCPGTRTTYKAGALGCADTSFGYYTVTPTGSLAITVTSVNPTICGACDGSITIHGLTPGLVDTITYDLASVPQPPVIATVSGGGTITITGLCAGSYTNIIGHQGSCPSLPHTATLTDPAISISSVTTTDPTQCGACDGTLTVHGLYASHAFTLTYNYNGTPQPPVVTTTTAAGTIMLTGLCAGTYDNIVAFYSGCTTPAVGPYVLTNPPIAISGVTVVNATACGVCDGSLTLHGLYPIHTFTVTYNFNGVPQPAVATSTNGAGDITLSGLCAGIYDNIIAFYPSCSTPPVGPYTITAPPPPVFNIIASTNPSQCGFCDGTITIRAVPPLTADTIYYSLNGTPQPPVVVVALPDSTLHISNLCAGNYTGFTVKVGPCLSTVIGSANLTTVPVVSQFSDEIHYGCHGDTVFFTNSSLPPGINLWYVWNYGDGTTDTATSPYHVFAQGVYTVTLTATNHACTDDSSVVISLIHPLHAIFRASPVLICQGDQVNFNNVTDSASSPLPITYAWSFGDGQKDNSTSPSHSYPISGTYKVQLIATNFIPCNDTTYATIQVDSISPVVINLTDSVLCRATAVTFLGNYTTVGNTGITWYFGDGDSIVNINPVVHSYDVPGTYTVTATAHYRICSDRSASRTVNLFDAPNVYLGPDTTICPGSNAMLLKDINDFAANHLGIQWKWSTGQTTPMITIVAPGTYYVDAYMNGCHSTDTIHVAKDCYMDIPNVFTPNADGMNDYFFPRQWLTRGLTSFSMSIYNRWGQEVFTTNTLDGSGWDGKFNGVDQPVGVYVYVIDGMFKDGQKEHHQGNVTLLR